MEDKTKTQEMLDLWCSAPDIEFVDSEAEEAYKSRTRRIADAIQLKTPDRVPVTPMWEYYYGVYSKVSCYDGLYNPDIASWAVKKTITELQPDAFEAPFNFMIGPVLDALGQKDLIWAGHGVSYNSAHQYLEGEHLKADEYEALIEDPGDAMLRIVLPRVCGNLKGFEALAPLRNTFPTYAMSGQFAGFGTPEGKEALSALMKAGEASLAYVNWVAATSQAMYAQGFPCFIGGISFAPYDAVADSLRGTHGTMMDMYRRPEVLKAACEKYLWVNFKLAMAATEAAKNPLVLIPLHKGTASTRDGKGAFMSPAQFEEFYWHYLRRLMMMLIENGRVPHLLLEGDFTSRLEIIKDVPPGTCVYHFEEVDIPKAKEVLGDRVCLRGKVPIQLMWMGTPQDVKDYCKNLIDIWGEGGGFIMDLVMASEQIKPENMKAMIEFTKEYGVYR